MDGQETMDEFELIEAHAQICDKTISDTIKSGDSEIQRFYYGTTAFVTGGSGFLGKQLIEKLFRATKVSKIFILLRSKKGKDIKERFREILQDPVYDCVREHHPGFEQKLVPIAGDVGEVRLGMCDSDWNNIAEETDLIFHLAATTRFDEVLRVATFINVRGTRDILALASECRKLKSFVHVSTAYSSATNRTNNDILEEFYKSPVDPEALIRLVETVEETRLNDMKPDFIKGWPNTYTFTKAVAEELIRIKGRHLPICILRPTIVICSYREPTLGWVDMSCVYGGTGLVLGLILGVIHVLNMNNDVKTAFIPVDYVNNATIVAGWDTAKSSEEDPDNKEVKIYNIAPSNKNPMIWRTMHDLFSRVASKYTSPEALWCVFCIITANPFLFFTCNLIFHIIPAYIIDGILFILRKKLIAVKLSKKLTRMLKLMSYFILKEWNFKDTNAIELYGKLSSTDKQIFEFDPITIDWTTLIWSWGFGVRKYIIKDGVNKNDKNKTYKKQLLFRLLSLFLIGPVYLFMFYKLVLIVLRVIWSVIDILICCWYM